MKKPLIVILWLFGVTNAFAAVTLVEKDQWKFSMGGFVEVDGIVDSTRSLGEEANNTPIDRPDSLNGQTGRTQLSIRNSRLAFTLDAPDYEGWKTKGYFEFDLLGFNPQPGANNTEKSLFDNPTFRARHIYLSGESNGWQLMAGQYWRAFGWQPYYFMPTAQVSPVSGMLYGRTAQIRAVKSVALDDNTLQAMVAVMRPPQRDANYPGLEGGLRFAFGGRSGGYTGGASGPQKTQPMSLGVSGLVREFAIPNSPNAPMGDLTHLPGTALAVDALLPVLASADGKDVSNTLVLGGEFTTGTGYGDQFAGWTGSQANPLNSLTAVTPEKNVNLDAGIGGFDANGNFQLMDLRTFNAYFQYHFAAESRTWVSGGYGRLFSDNANYMTLLTGANAGKTSNGKFPYNKQEVFFGNIFHDLTKQIRVAFEYAHGHTVYSDTMDAHNNRYQLGFWFIF